MNTEEYICRKLLEMMEEKPFLKIKVKQLCEYAEISRSTFYVYFDSIYDVVQKIEDDLLFRVPEDGDYRSLQSVDSLAYARDNLRVLKLLTGPNGDPSFESRLANRNRATTQHFLRDRSRSGELTTEEELINAFLEGGKYQLLQWWGKNEDKISLQEMREILNKLLDAVYHVMEEES